MAYQERVGRMGCGRSAVVQYKTGLLPRNGKRLDISAFLRRRPESPSRYARIGKALNRGSTFGGWLSAFVHAPERSVWRSIALDRVIALADTYERRYLAYRLIPPEDAVRRSFVLQRMSACTRPFRAWHMSHLLAPPKDAGLRNMTLRMMIAAARTAAHVRTANELVPENGTWSALILEAMEERAGNFGELLAFYTFTRDAKRRKRTIRRMAACKRSFDDWFASHLRAPAGDKRFRGLTLRMMAATATCFAHWQTIRPHAPKNDWWRNLILQGMESSARRFSEWLAFYLLLSPADAKRRRKALGNMSGFKRSRDQWLAMYRSAPPHDVRLRTMLLCKLSESVKDMDGWVREFRQTPSEEEERRSWALAHMEGLATCFGDLLRVYRRAGKEERELRSWAIQVMERFRMSFEEWRREFRRVSVKDAELHGLFIRKLNAMTGSFGFWQSLFHESRDVEVRSAALRKMILLARTFNHLRTVYYLSKEPEERSTAFARMLRLASMEDLLDLYMRAPPGDRLRSVVIQRVHESWKDQETWRALLRRVSPRHAELHAAIRGKIIQQKPDASATVRRLRHPSGESGQYVLSVSDVAPRPDRAADADAAPPFEDASSF